MRISADASVRPQTAGAASGSSVPGDLGLSFAELLEAGSTADAVSGNRARGFSEAGIMGLHFAVGAGNALPVDTSDTPPEGVAPAEIGLDLDSAAATSPAYVSPAVTLGDGLQSASTPLPYLKDRRGSAKPSHQIGASESPARAGGLPAAGDEGEPSVRFLPRFRPPVQDGGGSALRIKLLSAGEGIGVVADGFGQDEDTRRELENAAREIAAEFGVSVQKFIVGSTSSLGR